MSSILYGVRMQQDCFLPHRHLKEKKKNTSKENAHSKYGYLMHCYLFIFVLLCLLICFVYLFVYLFDCLFAVRARSSMTSDKIDVFLEL